MGLAQKKIKQRIPSDPRNTKWTKETNTFGFRMLEKMGWKAGSGLGSQEQGSSVPLIPVIHESTEGIGMKELREERSRNWESTLQSYDSMLRALSVNVSNQITNVCDNTSIHKRLSHKRKLIQSKSSIYHDKNGLKNILGIRTPHTE